MIKLFWLCSARLVSACYSGEYNFKFHLGIEMLFENLRNHLQNTKLKQNWFYYLESIMIFQKLFLKSKFTFYQFKKFQDKNWSNLWSSESAAAAQAARRLWPTRSSPASTSSGSPSSPWTRSTRSQRITKTLNFLFDIFLSEKW